MKLIYIYLEEFRNFKKQGFSFSSEYNITFKEDNEQLIFRIDKNPNHIEDFFDDEPIVEVTAVIGENGAGKSNILDFIRFAFPSGLIGFKEKALVIYKHENEVCYYSSLSSGIDLKSSETPKRILNGEHKRIKGINEERNQIEHLLDATYIFYSNNVDLKISSSLQGIREEWSDEERSYTGIHNISTQGMLTNDSESDGLLKDASLDRIDIYKISELNRNIDFILDNTNLQSDLITFKLPDYLQIQFDYRLLNFLKESRSNYSKNWEEILSNLIESRKKNDKKSVILRFYSGIISQILLYGLPEKDALELETKYFSSRPFKIEFEEFAQEFIEYLLTEGSFKKSDLIKIKKSKLFIEKTINLIEDNILVPVEGGLNVLIFKDLNTNKEEALELYSLYTGSKFIGDYLSFQWRNLSSGEQSFLTLLSRFHFLAKADRITLNNDVVVLVDEGDLYFHPEWQRKYLKLFIDNIPRILGKEKKYQFIFTANSPFLAADLPADKIIFLKDNLVDFNPERRTFAANIHTLLSDGFFLSSFLGEFAQAKIEKVAKQLNSNNEVSDEEKKKLKVTIQAVGEEIIRNRLITLFEEKFKERFQERDIEDEIAALEERLKKLKKHQEGGSDD